MATIYIDDKPFEVKDGQNLLDACLSLGFNVPYFCWHPAMHSIGACRQCAVKQFKDENDKRGRIVMSCMTPANHGTRISIDDPDAIRFRRSVIEWLMLNHPHDCPVCDEGGECHLQDMTVMTGHTYRRNRFRKRTHLNQYLGPFLNHEMNRCIQCYRCVRFYREYAGGDDFNVFGSHDHVYFGRHKEGILESEFSGNLVEVCPTGVFTDRTFKRRYTRKWDLQTAPSVCIHCGLGCNIIPGERAGELRRILNRYNGEVNGYFLCDRGRFGYDFVNSDRRLRQPVLSVAGERKSVSRKEVLDSLSHLLYFGANVIGIGSPRASLEANFALRTLVGPEYFYQGISEREFRMSSLIKDIMQKGPARSPSLHEVEKCDAILVLGEDVTNSAPMLSLALQRSIRQKPMKACQRLRVPEWHHNAVCDVIQDERGPLFVATPVSTKLDRVATLSYHSAPDNISRLGHAVAHALDPKAPEVPGLSDEMTAFAERAASALSEAENPLIISGMGCGSESVIRAAANVSWALHKADRTSHLCFVVPECNSLGLSLIGGASLDSAIRDVREKNFDTVIVLENDIFRRTDSASLDEFCQRCRHIIVIDSLETATALKAGVVLPAGTFAESDGTIVNNEGRAQRYFKVMKPGQDIQESWRWLLDLIVIADKPEAAQWKLFEDITNALSESIPAFRPVREISPPAGFRMTGMKIPRQPHRYSGRTAMAAHMNVHEARPPDDPDAPLSFSMEGFEGIPPSTLIARFWSPGWNSVQSVNKFQSETGGPLRGGDPGSRLIEPAAVPGVTYFNGIPAAFEPDAEEKLVVPLHHIFGSEELSALSPAIIELAPEPYIALNPADMEGLRVEEGAETGLMIGGGTVWLPVRRVDSIPSGVAGLPSGLVGLIGIDLPLSARLRKRGEGGK
ncbi:MAG TPA: NADH-quinone oxidoreductase subunit NuoG [Thermodesulfovibrionales bacterium]|nr:NADH-quinone oxidoreductase subunit NuoG [Thermodesulfovibrionales bacterium]